MLLVILVFPPVWGLFRLGESNYRQVVSAFAEGCYRFTRLQFNFENSGDQVYFSTYNEPPFEGRVLPRPLYSNLPFMVSLLLVTPGLRLARRARLLGIGVLLLGATHVFFLIVKVEVTLLSAQHPFAGSPWLWHGLDDFFDVTGKAFFPVAIWLMLTLPYMMGRLESAPTAAPDRRLGRNDPCPCGSGKKYKKCCAVAAKS